MAIEAAVLPLLPKALAPWHSDYDSLDVMGVGAAHFGAGFFGCEHPFDAGAGGVSLLLPCGDFTDEARGVVDSAIQTLAAEHPDLDLGPVEPAGMPGGVLELQASQNSPGRLRRRR